MSDKTMFKADRNQLIAVVAMIAAIFTFAAGEPWIGGILFATSAVFSLGGLFWDAHRRDRTDAAEQKRGASGQPGSDIDRK